MNKKSFIMVFILVLIVFFLGISYKSESVSALSSVHNCDDCHQLHNASGGPLLAEINAENTCLTCHSPTGSATVVSNHVGYTCINCHDPHDNVQNRLGGTNLKLVRAKVEGSDGTLRDVVFESRGTDVGDPVLHSFCDGDLSGNGDAVCDTCHIGTTQHIGYPTSRKHQHQKGRTCTNSTGCHPHANNFEKF